MSTSKRVQLDSRRLRCLAHPLRSRLLAALRQDGPSTSTMLAERLGTNTGATSYHLRQLADVGLVVDDDTRGNARERWWRAAHEITSWSETDFDDDPTDRAAAEWLATNHARIRAQWRDDWLATRHQYSTAWREAADSSDIELRLTPAQLSELNAKLLEVIEHYVQPAERPAHDGTPVSDLDDASVATSAEAERVIILVDTFPARELRL